MKLIKRILQILLAGMVSIGILCALLCAYYIIPVHIDNPNRNTDYIWPANSIWVRGTEGFSFGRYDANGYNNLSVIENPDIIVVGSSQVEADNVMQNQNATYLLGEKLADRYSVYNMGMTKHFFDKVCQSLPASLAYSEEVPKVVIIETDTLILTEEYVSRILSSSVEYLPSYNEGLLAALQKVPFFRLAYHQIDLGLLDSFTLSSVSASQENVIENLIQKALDDSDKPIEEEAFQKLFSYLKEIEEKYGTQVIVFYHPQEVLTREGAIDFYDEVYREPYARYAAEYGISFVDMTERFEQMFYEENHVPHGFATGYLTSGHINKYGHAAIADELYQEILRLEEAGLLCP